MCQSGEYVKSDRPMPAAVYRAWLSRRLLSVTYLDSSIIERESSTSTKAPSSLHHLRARRRSVYARAALTSVVSRKESASAAIRSAGGIGRSGFVHRGCHCTLLFQPSSTLDHHVDVGDRELRWPADTAAVFHPRRVASTQLCNLVGQPRGQFKDRSRLRRRPSAVGADMSPIQQANS